MDELGPDFGSESQCGGVKGFSQLGSNAVAEYCSRDKADQAFLKPDFGLGKVIP